MNNKLSYKTSVERDINYKFNHIAKCIFLPFILFILVLLVSLLNIHLELHDFQDFKTFKVENYLEVRVLRDSLISVFCDSKTTFCYENWNCPTLLETNDIQYEWNSNVVNEPNSNILIFRGNGICTVKYNNKRFELSWL